MKQGCPIECTLSTQCGHTGYVRFRPIADIGIDGHYLRMSDDTWLAEIGIVNETTSVANAGNVSIFRSAADACLFFDQYCGSGFVLSVDGDRIEIEDGIDEDIVVRRVPYPDGKKIARAWLETRAAKTLEERKRAARRGNVVLNAVEERDELPRSTMGLIAYIGFSG